MTEADWLAIRTAHALREEFAGLTDRKLHLLTVALLRQVWELLPSDHTRRAVEATERFADGLTTSLELARLRSTDMLETCDQLWLASDSSPVDLALIDPDFCCWCIPCQCGMTEAEERVLRSGIIPGVKRGIETPDWIAAKAVCWAREMVAWKAGPEERELAVTGGKLRQLTVYRDIAGDGWPTDPCWPRWRTGTVRALARGLYRDRAFDRLPILADALQDAGCDDEAVLTHCREATTHARGCWVVDLALGVV